jgi:hypothetical protein
MRRPARKRTGAAVLAGENRSPPDAFTASPNLVHDCSEPARLPASLPLARLPPMGLEPQPARLRDREGADMERSLPVF